MNAGYLDFFLTLVWHNSVFRGNKYIGSKIKLVATQFIVAYIQVRLYNIAF